MKRLCITRNSTAVSAALLLDACGGGGGGVNSPGSAPRVATPAPTPAPSPSPPPTPTSSADGAEYKSSAAVMPNAALIAPALRQAVATGAFVTVVSINGRSSGQITTDQRSAMDAVRAADRLLVESVSNVNGADSFSGQFAESLVGADRANKDWFLFAIGVDANGSPRGANGNAGALADRMIAAVGVNVQAVQKDGYARAVVAAARRTCTRVAAGAVAYDLMSGALAEERRTVDPSPSARELELGWSTAFAPTSTLRLGIARAFDAGHVRGASDTALINLVIR